MELLHCYLATIKLFDRTTFVKFFSINSFLLLGSLNTIIQSELPLSCTLAPQIVNTELISIASVTLGFSCKFSLAGLTLVSTV